MSSTSRMYSEIENSAELILDFDPNTLENLVKVPKCLTQILKPHQRDGVQFMWDRCFDSIDKIENEADSGGGCILAHSMGLGKC